jgi:hypothetical protein
VAQDKVLFILQVITHTVVAVQVAVLDFWQMALLDHLEMVALEEVVAVAVAVKVVALTTICPHIQMEQVAQVAYLFTTKRRDRWLILQ